MRGAFLFYAIMDNMTDKDKDLENTKEEDGKVEEVAKETKDETAPAPKPAKRGSKPKAKKAKEPEKIAIFMRQGESWANSKLRFTKERPFQLVDQGTADHLLKDERFEVATREQVKEFYGIEQ